MEQIESGVYFREQSDDDGRFVVYAVTKEGERIGERELEPHEIPGHIDRLWKLLEKAA